MTNEQETKIKDSILHDIRSGGVAMRPKLYFTLHVVALALLSGAILVVSVFIWNFILFTIRIGSHDTLLGFGLRGWEVFLMLFPWHLVLIDTILIIGLQLLLRRFRFGYKIPVLYLLAALLFATVVVGFALDRGTALNDHFYERGGRGLPGPVGGLYNRAHHPFVPGSGVCRCTIVAIVGSTLTVEDTRDSTTTLTVMLPSDDPRATTTNLKVGDTVFIAGEEENGVIRAFGVHKEQQRGMGPGPGGGPIPASP